MDERLSLLHFPNEILEHIGRCLVYKQVDIHIESSSESTPAFSYELCSEQVEEFSKACMQSHGKGTGFMLEAYLHDITSFRLTCRHISKVMEGVLRRQLRGCIFDQKTFEKFNTSVETDLGNAKSFLRVRLRRPSFEISFLKKLPSTYLWKVDQLEIFLHEPDDPNESADLQKLLPEFSFRSVKMSVDLPCFTEAVESTDVIWQPLLAVNYFGKETVIPASRLHAQCRRGIQRARTQRQHGRPKGRAQMSLVQSEAQSPPMEIFAKFMSEQGFI